MAPREVPGLGRDGDLAEGITPDFACCISAPATLQRACWLSSTTAGAWDWGRGTFPTQIF